MTRNPLPALLVCCAMLCLPTQILGWGFYGHRKINFTAVFLLPPEMLVFYKPNIAWLSEHAVDPDKRRYAIAAEGPRHYIDLDRYGQYPWPNLPRRWEDAVARYSEDSLMAHGIVPWWVQTMYYRLVEAFRQKDPARILKLSAEIGHYISDAHVPLHASSNHNGQHTGQHGIHGFWESRLPELFAEQQYDFLIGRATLIPNPGQFIWQRVMESGAAADTVLRVEARLNTEFPADRKFAFEERQGVVVRQYSTAYAAAYQARLKGMVERRMIQSVHAVASYWYSAWVEAGQPALNALLNQPVDNAGLETLNEQWLKGKVMGRACE